MSHRQLIAQFSEEDHIVAAATAVRKEGYEILDAYTPFPSHGLIKAMKLPASRLTWVCFIGGLLGAGFMFWFQYWSSAISWPVNIGGKPWDSHPAFIPVTFESMILVGGVSTVFALFIRSKLWPGKRGYLPTLTATDDRFVLVFSKNDATYDFDEAKELCAGFECVEFEERLTDPDDRPAFAWRSLVPVVNLALVIAIGLLVLVNVATPADPGLKNWEVLTEMVHSRAYESQSANPHVTGRQTLLRPVPGTVVRGFLPMHYSNTPGDAKRAGYELANPLKPSVKNIARGTAVYQNFCEVCHGGGLGNGPVSKFGVPPPPSLFAKNALAMPDGELFHIISYGGKNMPGYAARVDRNDRWRAILYVRSMQVAMKAAAAAEAKKKKGAKAKAKPGAKVQKGQTP